MVIVVPKYGPSVIGAAQLSHIPWYIYIYIYIICCARIQRMYSACSAWEPCYDGRGISGAGIPCVTAAQLRMERSITPCPPLDVVMAFCFVGGRSRCIGHSLRIGRFGHSLRVGRLLWNGRLLRIGRLLFNNCSRCKSRSPCVER